MYIFQFKGTVPVLLKTPYDALFDQLQEIYQSQSGSGRMTVIGNKWISNNSLAITVGGGGYGDSKTYAATITCDERTGAHIDRLSIKFK